MIALVDYTVNVVAHVDTETGEVVKVVPYMDGISQGTPIGVKDYGTDENGDKIDRETMDKAYSIASVAEWPAWDI